MLTELLLQDAELPEAAERARGHSLSPIGAGDPSRQAVLGLPAQPCSSATSGGSHSGQSVLLGPAKQCRRAPGVY